MSDTSTSEGLHEISEEARGQRVAEVDNFFCGAFNPARFRRWLELWTRDRSLILNLPGEIASAEELYHRGAKELGSRGYLDSPNFLDALLGEEPQWRERLITLARSCRLDWKPTNIPSQLHSGTTNYSRRYFLGGAGILFIGGITAVFAVYRRDSIRVEPSYEVSSSQPLVDSGPANTPAQPQEPKIPHPVAEIKEPRPKGGPIADENDCTPAQDQIKNILPHGTTNDSVRLHIKITKNRVTAEFNDDDATGIELAKLANIKLSYIGEKTLKSWGQKTRCDFYYIWHR